MLYMTERDCWEELEDLADQLQGLAAKAWEILEQMEGDAAAEAMDAMQEADPAALEDVAARWLRGAYDDEEDEDE